jgi:hypothetical protein
MGLSSVNPRCIAIAFANMSQTGARPVAAMPTASSPAAVATEATRHARSSAPRSSPSARRLC